MRRMYSEKQIKDLAKFVAENNLGDVDLNVASINAKGMAITGTGAITGNLAVGGAITGKTIKQSEANYLFEFEVNAENQTHFEKVGEQYCRIEEVNGEIHIIVMAAFKNIDAAPQNFRLSPDTKILLPDYLASKIYGLNHNLMTPDGGMIRCVGCYMPRLESTYTISSASVVLQGGTDAKYLYIYQPSQNSVASNNTIFVSFEVNLSVL